MGRLSDKVALISGGATGIGRACAIAMAYEGARVFVADIDAEGAAETCAQAQKNGGSAEAVHLDVTSEQDWAAAIAFVSQAAGRLDILVNNAGICALSPLADTTLERWRRIMAVNLDGTFLGTRAAIPLMTASGGGSIVNMSSTTGLVGAAHLSAYSASKGGIRMFTKSIAIECATLRNGIRVNSVHPGGIETPIWGKVAHDGTTPEGGPIAEEIAMSRELATAHSPVGSYGQPEDVAAGVVYLASDEARFVTGSELVIDGGATAV